MAKNAGVISDRTICRAKFLERGVLRNTWIRGKKATFLDSGQICLVYLYIKARNLCLSVCVCLKYLCGSGSGWPESFHMAAAWFKGVQRCICLDYNDTVNVLFQKCFTNSTSIANHSHHSHVCTRVRTEFVPVCGDTDTHGQQSGIGICGCSCVASC